MRFRDLPRCGIIKKPLNRKIYDLLWAPFQMVLEIIFNAANFLKIGMGLAFFGWSIVMIFMLLMSAATIKVAIGIGIISLVSGLGISVLLGIIRAFQ